MTSPPRKMSEIMKEMAERLLRRPDAVHSTEAAHVSLMFAHIAWNETVGLGGDRQGYRPAWEEIEAHNPEMWSEFKSNDVDAMIDQLVVFKQQHHPEDQRRVLSCGIPNGNVRVVWLNAATPGVDSRWEFQLYGLVNIGQQEQAIEYVRETQRVSLAAAKRKVQEVAAALDIQPLNQGSQKPQRKTPVAKRKSAGTGVSDEAKAAFEEIAALVEAFCLTHLNEEYAEACRRLTEKLARKRPSPPVSGKAATWASGIVRTIGWVNFLDDKAQSPHMKLPVIDKAFGVAESTGQGKSMLIRKMFKIASFDHHWTLPSRLDDNPLIWMLTVNGLLMDIRDLPREAQEIAFEKGLIPYIPADRASDSASGA